MKKSFTLIEVMISVVIFSILVLFMSKVVASLNLSKKVIQQSYYKEHKNSLLVKVLYNDILKKDSIKLINNNKNYTILYIQTANSLYNISMPYVVWFVSKIDNSLMRLESFTEIKLPIQQNNFYLDKFDENVKIFKIYEKNGKYFIFIKDKKEIYFEM